MGFLFNCLYAVIVAAIRSYKYIELQFLKMFSVFLRKIMTRHAEKLGIVLHLPDALNDELTSEEEKRILEKSGYSSVCRLKVRNTLFFPLIASTGMLAIAEEYVDGGWEIIGSDEEISEFMSRIMEKNVFEFCLHPINRFLLYLEYHTFNLQTTSRVFEVAKKHYDLGNDLFESFLDPWMQYTCGYWENSCNLNDAQVAKMDLIARKLDLKPGMSVLDVGCGWGTLCKYLAENYGVKCVGITIGAEGVKYGEEKCKGLPVEFRLQDYRKLNEKFDRIVSVGMFEHVGPKNYRRFFEVMHNCLKDDGIFLLHTIGINHNNMPLCEPFAHKYIFPNGCLPYYLDLMKKMEGLFVIEDLHNFGPHYVKTLRAWRENFHKNWPTIADKYGERFYRLWNIYLSAGVGLFKSRKSQLWQIVLSKDGLKREYRAAR